MSLMNPLRIIALAPNAWDGPWMNRQNLLSRLASEHKIVYSNGIWSSWQRGSTAYRRSPLFSRFEEHDGVCVDRRGRVLVRIPRIKLLDRLAIQAACVRWRGHLAGSPGPLVAYVFHPEYLPFVRAIGADHIVYHAYDLFRFMGQGGDAVEAAENTLLEVADLVIATSQETADDMRSRRDRRVEVLGNGVDLNRFASGSMQPEPPELANIPHPRVGYVGAINQKVDLELILALARRQPSWQFVFVGEIGNLGPGDAELIGEMRVRENIHLLKPVVQSRLSGVLQNLDVGLVCYRMLRWTIAGYPLKMLEYLACGLPVVASDLPAVRQFEGVIAISKSADEWEAAIAAALAGQGRGAPADRQAVARANSWDARAAQLSSLLQEMVLSASPERRYRPA